MAESKTVLPRRTGWLLFAAGLPGCGGGCDAAAAPCCCRPNPPSRCGRFIWSAAAQSVLLLGVAVFIGYRCAPRMGLVLRCSPPCWTDGTGARPGAGNGYRGGGAPASAGLLLACRHWRLRHYWQAKPPEMPGLARLLYGGITEGSCCCAGGVIKS